MRTARWCGVLVAVAAALVLVAWWVGIDGVIQLDVRAGILMPNAVLGFLLAGVALAVRASPVTSRTCWRLVEVASWMVVVIGAATLLQWLLGVDLSIDKVLVADRTSGSSGRMAPSTALDLVLLGVAMLLVDAERRELARMGHALALIAGLVGMAAAIWYVYGAGPTFGPGDFTNQMALPAALGFMVLSLGVQLSRPDHLLVALAASPGPAGVLIRRLLPASLALPVAVGWILLEGLRAGHYDTELGFAFYCSASVVSFAALVAWIARAVEHQDGARRANERELEVSHGDLKLRVELRTVAIREVNATLRREVAERERAQESERDSAQLLRAIIDSADYAVITAGMDGTIQSMNATAERWLGWRADEVTGRFTLDFVHDPWEVASRAETLSRELGTPIESSFETLVAMARRGSADENEWTYVRKDGSRFPVLLSVTALRDSHGAPRGFLGIASDQTERRRADGEVREFRVAMEHAVEGIARVDAQGKFIRVNAAYAAMLGRSREEMVGRPWQCTVQADQIDAMEQAHARMLASGKVQTETVGVRGDGSTFDKHVVMVAVRGAGGEQSGHYCFSKDISNQKQAQRDLVRAKLAAEAAMRARSDFLARMSHEIRTPMNGVIGMAQLALETELTLQQREYVETARSSAASLLHLIDDILDFTKIDSGHLRLESIPFQLRSCLGSALKGLAQRAHSKGLTFLIDIPPAVPERLVGDPQRLAQIAINLVGNAIKFTERGQICLSVAVEERRGGRFLRFGVTDSGIGVDEDKQKAIFEDFAQADDGVTRRYGGTGLGLAICRQLVHLMGGEIGVESAPGQGSTFWFTARMELASETESEDDALAALRGKRVLIVELDENRRRVVGDLMRAWGMEPLLPDGEDPGEPPDFALVAAQIIEQRGVAAALTGIDHATPVLAVGPTGSPANTFANRWGGVVPVSWPITATGLHHATVDVSSASVSPGLVQPAVAQPARRLRILLAEDHPVNRKLATAVLERAGHGVTAVEDGRAAVAFALANDIDCVLMDVQMPIMDGVTATRLIRQSRPGGRGGVPIIGLTAQAMAEDRERGLEAGMDSYVVKPFEKAAFLAEIDRVVSRTGRRRAAERGRPRADTVSRPFDQALLLDRIGGDQDLLRLLIETFLDDLPGKRDALVGALATGECRELERVAHTLRGALLSLAATPSAEAARALELGAADSSPSLAAQAAALQYELDRLVPALKTTVRTE